MPPQPSLKRPKEKKPPKTAAEIRQEEWDQFVIESVRSHAGWLTQPILSLSSQLSKSPVHTALALAIPVLVLLLVSPSNWVPHLAAPITLLIPVQNTVHSIVAETKKDRQDAKDAQQWAMFWCAWCLMGLIGGWIGVFRPGWRGLWEVWRVVALVLVGGPWFGRASLRSAGPSPELRAAEKVEEAEAQKAKQEAAKRKEKEEKLKRDKAAKEDKDKKKEGSKAGK